jgi:hypothetical protein
MMEIVSIVFSGFALLLFLLFNFAWTDEFKKVQKKHEESMRLLWSALDELKQKIKERGIP